MKHLEPISPLLMVVWQVSFLGLLNLGDGSCIASKGSLAMHGQWLWELKDWIDRRWMWNYSEGGEDRELKVSQTQAFDKN